MGPFGAGRGWGGGGAYARRIPILEEVQMVIDEKDASSPLLKYARWREDYLTQFPEKRLFPTVFRFTEKALEPVYMPQKFVKFTPKTIEKWKQVTAPITFMQKYGGWILLGLVLLAVSE